MAKPTVFTTGGAVQASGGLYIPRRADDEMLPLCRSGAFAFVLTARQMGKSSLMVRTAERLLSEGCRSVILDLTHIGAQVSAEQWYVGMLTTIEEQLGLETSAYGWWQERQHLSMAQRMILFIQDVVLEEIREQVVIFVDEIDTTLSLGFTDDFFAAIRYMYNARAAYPVLQRLSVVLLGVASPTDLIHDTKRTPFNLGHRVDLADFKFEEAIHLPLAEGLGMPPAETVHVLHWVLSWTGGHPYLTQRLCRALAEDREAQGEHVRPYTAADVQRVVTNTFFGKLGERDHNLQFVRNMLLKGPDPYEVLLTYRKVLTGVRPVKDEEQSIIKSHLKLSGIVHLENGVLRVRNRIYEKVFDAAWVREHMPVNWKRRFKRVALISFAVLLVLVICVILQSAINRQTEALRALERVKAQEQLAQWEKARSEDEKRRAESSAQTESRLRQQLETVNKELTLSKQELEISNQRLAVAVRDLKQRNAILKNINGALINTWNDRVEFESSKVELAVQLASDAERLRREGSDVLPLSILLAIEATNRYQSSITDQPLRLGLSQLARSVRRFTLGDAAREVAFSPDGVWLAAGGEDKKICVWNASTGQEKFCALQDAAIQSAVFSPDGKLLAVASDGRIVRVWDVASGDARFSFPHEDAVLSLAFSPNGKVLATASADGLVRLWDTVTGRVVYKLSYSGAVRSVRFTSGGTYLATAGDDGWVRVWQVTRWSPFALASTTATEWFNGGGVWDLAFSTDGKYLAAAGEDKRVRVWSFVSRRLAVLEHDAPVHRLAFHPTRPILASSTGDHLARLWEADTGRLAHSLSHESSVSTVRFSPDGQMLATTGDGVTASVWRVKDGRRFTLPHDGAVRALSFNPNGALIATASRDRTVRTWELDDGQQLTKLPHEAPVKHATYSPDGQFLATFSSSNTAYLWTAAGNRIAKLLHQDEISSIAFSNDSKHLATSSLDNTARVWESATGKPVVSVSHKASVVAAAFSPDDKFLATASRDRTACIWDVATGNSVACVGHDAPVNHVAFSADGTLLATGSRDRAACIWEAATGRRLRCVTHEDSVYAVAFSPDGNLLVTASRDKTVGVWDVEKGESKASLAQEDPIQLVAFSPDNRLLATSSWDNTVRVWDPTKKDPVAVLKHDALVGVLAFSRDGQYLATAGTEKLAIIWQLSNKPRQLARIPQDYNIMSLAFSPDGARLVAGGDNRAAAVLLWRSADLAKVACARLDRNLTKDEWKRYLASEQYQPTCQEPQENR